MLRTEKLYVSMLEDKVYILHFYDNLDERLILDRTSMGLGRLSVILGRAGLLKPPSCKCLCLFGLVVCLFVVKHGFIPKIF